MNFWVRKIISIALLVHVRQVWRHPPGSVTLHKDFVILRVCHWKLDFIHTKVQRYVKDFNILIWAGLCQRLWLLFRTTDQLALPSCHSWTKKNNMFFKYNFRTLFRKMYTKRLLGNEIGLDHMFPCSEYANELNLHNCFVGKACTNLLFCIISL